MGKIRVFVEEGQKKTFVVAIDWPGWACWGKEESAAFESLIDFAPRYSRVVRAAGLDFRIPEYLEDFEIIARVEGNATTSFGAPDIQLDEEKAPLSLEEYQRQRAILVAAWEEFDRQLDAAWGKDLRKGPRGGGRDLEKIILHTLQADEAYLKRLARKIKLVLRTHFRCKPSRYEQRYWKRWWLGCAVRSRRRGREVVRSGRCNSTCAG